MDVLYIVLVVISILVSMTIHEFMHGYVAYLQGDNTAKFEGRLTLNPIKHIDPFLTLVLPIILALTGAPIFGGAKPVPINTFALRNREWGMAMVAAAGPLSNLVIAFFSFGLYTVGVQQGFSVFVINFLSIMVMVNLGFFLFNIIPIPPLDGSRVLYALAPEFVQKGMDFVERYSLLIIFALVMVFNNLIGQYIANGGASILTFFRFIFGV